MSWLPFVGWCPTGIEFQVSPLVPPGQVTFLNGVGFVTPQDSMHLQVEFEPLTTYAERCTMHGIVRMCARRRRGMPTIGMLRARVRHLPRSAS